MKVTIDIDDRLWWKLAGQAEKRGVHVDELIGQMLIGTGIRAYERIQPHTAEAWKRAYEMGVSASAIAQRHDVTDTTVRRVLTRMGVTLRTKTEAVELVRQQKRAVPRV